MRVSARAAAGGEVVPRPFGTGHEQEEASRAPGTHSARGPILIADDEGPIVETLAFLVRAAGFTPVVASHGRQALELARANPPALVITDLMMPHLSGAKLIESLRGDAAAGGYTPPPIILITAAGPRATTASGADAVVTKPFALAEIELLLRRFLGPPPE